MMHACLAELFYVLVLLYSVRKVLMASGRPTTNSTSEERLRLYLGDLNRKQSRKDASRNHERRETLKLIQSDYPWLVQRSLPNVYVTNVVASHGSASRLALASNDASLVFVHQPMAGEQTMRQCLGAVAERRRLVLSQEFTAEGRKLWDSMNGTSYKSRFDLHQGHFAFGVCNSVHGRQCAYLTMVREPYERLRAWYAQCRTVLASDVWCRGAKHMTLKQWIISHGSTAFHQLVSNTFATCDQRSAMTGPIPCWQQQKGEFHNIPQSHLRRVLDYVLENLENWFSVIGIFEHFDSSMKMFAHAHSILFDSCINIPETSPDFGNDDVPDEVENSVRANFENNGRTIIDGESDSLLDDPDVQNALQADTEIYKRAKRIFHRQYQVYTNKIL